MLELIRGTAPPVPGSGYVVFLNIDDSFLSPFRRLSNVWETDPDRTRRDRTPTVPGQAINGADPRESSKQNTKCWQERRSSKFGHGGRCGLAGLAFSDSGAG